MTEQLIIELVPKTSWFINVRSMVSTEDWDTLRKESYRNSNYKCEICSGVGEQHPVECHEIWQYNDEKHIQKLLGLISLCPRCHETKHIGLANSRGRGEIAKEHLAKVNNWTKQKTDRYVSNCFTEWKKRSKFKWEIDLTWLRERRNTNKK